MTSNVRQKWYRDQDLAPFQYLVFLPVIAVSAAATLQVPIAQWHVRF
jgi:hypothetical protein